MEQSLNSFGSRIFIKSKIAMEIKHCIYNQNLKKISIPSSMTFIPDRRRFTFKESIIINCPIRFIVLYRLKG